jgi:hypothetical protein
VIIFLSSVFIDIDHYFYYISKKRNLNPFKAYEWYHQNVKKIYSLSKESRGKVYIGLYYFHGIEVLIIFFFLGAISPLFIFILIGFIFHLLADFISEVIFQQRLDKISIIYNIFTFRKLVHIQDFGTKTNL